MENIELVDDKVEDNAIIDNNIPREGFEFVSDEDAYNFYNEYGSRMGFSIRKEWGNRNKKTREITSRSFVCSKEGVKGPDKRDYKTKSGRAETRTCCNTCMTINFVKETGKFKIKKFVAESRVFKVIYDCKNVTVLCGCKKFEMEGILCCHALKVLDVMNIKLLPDKYIIKRWTKSARDGSVQDYNGHVIEVDPKLQATSRYRLLCSNMIKIASRASECEETYIFVGKEMRKMGETVDQIIKQKQSAGLEQRGVEKENCHVNVGSINARGLKKKVSCKRRPRRLKSWTEKSSTKKNKSVDKMNEKSFKENEAIKVDQRRIFQNISNYIPL